MIRFSLYASGTIGLALLINTLSFYVVNFIHNKTWSFTPDFTYFKQSLIPAAIIMLILYFVDRRKHK